MNIDRDKVDALLREKLIVEIMKHDKTREEAEAIAEDLHAVAVQEAARMKAWRKEHPPGHPG